MNQEGDVQRYGGLKAIKKDETRNEEGQDYDSSELRLRTHFHVSVLAGCYNVGSGRSGPNAIRVNGVWSTKKDRDEPNHNCVCWHQ